MAPETLDFWEEDILTLPLTGDHHEHTPQSNVIYGFYSHKTNTFYEFPRDVYQNALVEINNKNFDAMTSLTIESPVSNPPCNWNMEDEGWDFYNKSYKDLPALSSSVDL